jgi:hypothetical protein
VTLTASSDNTNLISNPSVTYTNPSPTATLTFTPAANVGGLASITVKVQDNGGTNGGGVGTLTRTFSVTVVSNPPSLHDYRSVASGNWSSLATWQMYNGTNWVTPAVAPNSFSGLTTLQSPYLVTNTGSVIVARVLVNSGAQLIVNPGSSFTVTNNFSGTNLDVFGVVNNAGTMVGLGLVMFEPGSRYVHSQDGGAIPNSTWSVNSLCLIGSITNASGLGGLGQAFYNLNWNCPNQAVRFDAAGALTNVIGKLSVTAAASTNSSAVGGHGVALSLAAGQTLVIGGDLNLTNVYLIPAGNNSTQGSGMQINLGGNVSTDGKYTGFYTDYTGDNRQLFGVINFVNTGTGSRISQGVNANTNWDTSEAYSYRLASGVTLDTGTNEARVWNFTNSPGSTMLIANADGIELGDDHGAYQAQQEFWKGGAAAVRFPNPATNYFEPHATYIYNGSVAQVTGSGLPSNVANLTINNPAVVSVNTHSGDAPYPFTPAGLNAVTGMLSVLSGTLNLSGTNSPTVNSLSGYGVITNGNVTVGGNGAGLLPGGASAAGTLTLDGTLSFGANAKATFDLSNDPENGANDEVVLIRNGTVAGNGAVVIVHPTTTLSQNDYVLFDVQGTGHVATDFYLLPGWFGTPPIGAGNYRVVTVNNQVLLRYVSTPQPIFSGPVVSGANLVLSGGGGVAGASYRMLSSTNIALPLASWTPVLTNNFASDGSFSDQLSFSAADARRFYCIIIP